MKRNRKLAIISMVLGAGLLVLGGCKGVEDVSAAEMVNKAIESEKQVGDYYGEAEMEVMIGEQKQKEKIKMKEFVTKDGQRKTVTIDENKNEETIGWNDGKRMVLYKKGDKEATEIDFKGEDMSDSTDFKGQMMTMLKKMKDSHVYELKGEAKIAGLQTNHLQLKAKKKDSLLGDMDIWVDQKTWMPIKVISRSGDNESEMVYTKVDFSPKFDKDTFKVDLPKDVKIVSTEDEIDEKEVSLQEAEKELGQPILVLPETEMKLSKIDQMKVKDIIGLTFNYVDKANKPLLTVAVSPVGKNTILKDAADKVRGQKGKIMEEIHSVIWEEEGLEYVISIEQPDVLKIEDVLKKAEAMQLRSK